MEAPRQRFSRLLTALDELVTREAATVQAGDLAEVQSIQRRTGALVNALAGMRPDAADPTARAHIADLLARRQHSIEFLESQLATARAELLAVQESTRRVARIAPVYGRPQSSISLAPQFRATG